MGKITWFSCDFFKCFFYEGYYKKLPALRFWENFNIYSPLLEHVIMCDSLWFTPEGFIISKHMSHLGVSITKMYIGVIQLIPVVNDLRVILIIMPHLVNPRSGSCTSLSKWSDMWKVSLCHFPMDAITLDYGFCLPFPSLNESKVDSFYDFPFFLDIHLIFPTFLCSSSVKAWGFNILFNFFNHMGIPL